jgi:hypothetical protein
MVAQARATEIERVLTETATQINITPLADMTIRLSQAAQSPPKYWLDPYR